MNAARQPPESRAWRALSLAALSGALLAFSLPPFDQGWLAWLSLAPLLGAARCRGGPAGLLLGLVSGTVCGAVHAGTPVGSAIDHMAWTPFVWLTWRDWSSASIAATLA